MKGIVAFALSLAIFIEAPIVLATASTGATYYGGTITAFDGAKDPVEGKIDTANEKALTFYATEKQFTGRSFSIPYDRVLDLEYGQKAGRRVGTAIATTVLFGPIGLVSLLSKKRKHFLTVGYTDEEGHQQALVFQVSKGSVRSMLVSLEAKTGRKVEFQDEEARKAGKG